MNKNIRISVFIASTFLTACGGSSNDSNIETPNNSNPVTYQTSFCEHVGNGQDFPVGPGLLYETVSDVPWNDLGPGDTVRIHWRSSPYQEKILIRTKGTIDQPIRVCGVPNNAGELPLLSGNGATSRADLAFGSYLPIQDLGLITIYHNDYYTKPANIVIENLRLEGSHPDYQYTNTFGDLRSYEAGAACIRVQAADNVIIRNNEISDCGNGLFAMSQDYTEFHLTRNILIEGNHLYDNGVVGSWFQHNLYIQAIGATYQYNRLGRNKAGAMGGNLKDRSVGTVIRYNWLDGSQRVIDLVEVQEYAQYVIEQVYLDSLSGPADPDRLIEVQANEAKYRVAHVYGNLIRNVGSTDGSLLIHYGYDTVPEYTRKGTLYFYNNTVAVLTDQTDHWSTRLFDVTTIDETVEAFNNIIYATNETGTTAGFLNITRNGNAGTVNLGVNWISDGWLTGSGTVNGLSNLIDTSLATAPINRDTLEPLNEPTSINQGQALPSIVTTEHPVPYQYSPHQGSVARSNINDLGAYDYIQ